jgi:dTDP-4-amino-4,6-dideoxy-D-galactose acyltransferase
MVGGLFLHSYYYSGVLFSKTDADLLFETWITNSIRGRADQVLVATQDERPLGFITCRIAADRTGIIELVGVGAEHNSRGLGKALVAAALQWFRDAGAPVVTVRTQAANVAALRMYSGTGGRPMTADTTLLKPLVDRAHI